MTENRWEINVRNPLAPPPPPLYHPFPHPPLRIPCIIPFPMTSHLLYHPFPYSPPSHPLYYPFPYSHPTIYLFHIRDSDWLNFIHFSGYKHKIRLVSILRKREDQALIYISTILKCSAQFAFKTVCEILTLTEDMTWTKEKKMELGTCLLTVWSYYSMQNLDSDRRHNLNNREKNGIMVFVNGLIFFSVRVKILHNLKRINL